MDKKMLLPGLCVVALALQISAISTEMWSKGTVPASSTVATAKVETNLGLWKLCGKLMISGKPTEKDCFHLPQGDNKKFPKNSLYAVRAFAVTGAVLIFVALGCMLMQRHKGKEMRKCTLACLIAGGISSLIANVIWATELLHIKGGSGVVTEIKTKPNVSFYLNLVGGLVALGASALCWKKM